MRLLIAALTGPLFYVSVKSASIGPRPCTDPVVSAPPNLRGLTCLFQDRFQFFFLSVHIVKSLSTL